MVVILSVTLLSLATGAWLLAQFGLAIWWAMIGALAVYATLLSLHLAARRSFATLDRVVTGARADAAADAIDDWPEDLAAQSALACRRPELSDTPAVGQAAPRTEGLSLDWDPLPVSARDEPTHELPDPRAADPFDFRPLRAPSLDQPGAEMHAEMHLESVLPRAEHAPPTEVNVEVIQDLIKKLADELNGPITAEQEPEPAAADAEAMIGRSVAALDATSRGMRTAAASQPGHQPAGNVPAWWPVAGEPEAQPKAGKDAGPKPPALNPQLARIAEAVAAERMEVLLEPIQALAEGRTRHFEVSVRLLTADGAALEQCDFARAVHGSGLMPRIDAERMIRAARVARRLGERGRHGSLLSAIAGESLADAEFLGTAARHQDHDGSMGLVLSFAQSEVRNFTTGHAEALLQLADAGYGFALDEVTDLDMDFGALQEMGFEFVKLDAPVFLDGLTAPGGRVPASDICRHLSDFGLTVIVGRIEDKWLRTRMQDLGVQFGKGTLFGGPKLVKPEVVATPVAA